MLRLAKSTLCFTLAGLAVTMAGSGNASAGVRIAAAGDISCPADLTGANKIRPGAKPPRPAAAKCQGYRVAKMIKARHPGLVLALGDLIQEQTSYEKAYSDFSRAWVGVLGKRIYSALGNHDYYRRKSGGFTASGYFDYWKRKGRPTRKVGRSGRGWDSWNVGRWHMIGLNSNCFTIDCSFTGRQLRWLAKDLKADRADRRTRCTLAYFHHPLFSAGVRRGRPPKGSLLVNIWELLYRYRTDVVMNGHQQFYERFRPQNPAGKVDRTGITEIISGTGGASTFPVRNEKGHLPRNSVSSYRGFGAAFLNLKKNGYTTSFRDLTGKVRDKHGLVKCKRPNAGHKKRVPRARRYHAHMKKMARLGRKVQRIKKHIRKLRINSGSIFRLNAQSKKLRRAKARRERVRAQTLY